MISLIKNIEEKIEKKFSPEKINLINNSHLHIKHKSFDANKVHLKLIIYCKKLREMNRMDAHKKIFSVLKDEMKNEIHALEIEIK